MSKTTSERTQTGAGTAFAKALQSDPNTRAGWERTVGRLEEFRRDVLPALQAAWQAVGNEIEGYGFLRPRTLDDWIVLAHAIEIPFDVVNRGEWTLAELLPAVRGWVQRETVRRKTAAGGKPKRQSTNRGKPRREPRTEPTPRQLEAWLAYQKTGTYEAARARLGLKSKSTVHDLVKAAEQTMNRESKSPRTKRLPTDARGQVSVAE
jgi:hypothetical protein